MRRLPVAVPELPGVDAVPVGEQMSRNDFGPFSGPGAVQCPPDCNPDLDLESLTKAQQTALGNIAIGNDGRISRRVIDVLKTKRLILEFPTEYLTGGLRMTVVRYGVPLCVHLAWCLWCSDEDANG